MSVPCIITSYSKSHSCWWIPGSEPSTSTLCHAQDTNLVGLGMLLLIKSSHKALAIVQIFTRMWRCFFNLLCPKMGFLLMSGLFGNGQLCRFLVRAFCLRLGWYVVSINSLLSDMSYVDSYIALYGSGMVCRIYNGLCYWK